MHKLKLLAISSLPTLGNAGLKNIMSVMGEDVIPIPTVIACGLGNMQGHKKLEVPFYEALHSALEQAQQQNYKLIIYVGYLYNKEQIDIIIHALTEFKNIIKNIIVDPICGDNGKTYVEQSIIENFDKLLKIADYAFPNETELRILSDFDFQSDIEMVIQRFLLKYPKLNLIATSVKFENNTFNFFIYKGIWYVFPYKKIDNANYSGTGDTFAALFIKYVYFEKQEPEDALSKISDYLSKVVAQNYYFQKASNEFSILRMDTSNMPKRGKLFYVIGPSGVGKDTLINLAKNKLKNTHVIFVQRYITRRSKHGGEIHIPIAKEDFIEQKNANAYALWWESHGNYYGISNKINGLLETGFNVVVNGSRAYHDRAVEIYPDMITILITARPETIKERLLQRNRESIEEIEKRLKRSEDLQEEFEKNPNVIILSNDSSLEISGAKFIHILREGHYFTENKSVEAGVQK